MKDKRDNKREPEESWERQQGNGCSCQMASKEMCEACPRGGNNKELWYKLMNEMAARIR
ncbi:MAG: hypothetical protein Q8911_13955 [Bacillota bacterium]|nr:hypothetical protein [Bacillota bacterium]